jgi:hypothetical protein
MRIAPIFLTLALVSGSVSAVWAQPAAKDDGAAADHGEADADGSEATSSDGGDGADAAAASEAAPEADLESLRAEYMRLRDRLFQSQARAATVASALYSTRLSIRLDYDSGRYYTVTRTTIRLDGANIYDDTEGAIAKDDATRFEGFVAPGRHLVSIHIEASGKDDERFTTIQEQSFVVQAVSGKDLQIRAKASDDGNLPYKWGKKQRGSYRLHLDVDVKTTKRKGKKGGHIKRTGGLAPHGTTRTTNA